MELNAVNILKITIYYQQNPLESSQNGPLSSYAATEPSFLV